MSAPCDSLTTVLAYHERTKHFPGRYARALGYLDWATQPSPFRRFSGAPLLPLDLVPVGDEPLYGSAFFRGRVSPAPLDRRSVSQLLHDSLALSAWKEAGGSRWSLRVNPSSGNLHPTEGYLLAGPIAGLHERPAVYHYAPREHALELRAELSEAAWAQLSSRLPPGSLLIGLTSIHWRESWKYGERAYRYCQHDVGHAIGALAVAAAGLGWEARLDEGVPDRELAALLGVREQRGTEAEHPECLLLVAPPVAGLRLEQGPALLALPALLVAELTEVFARIYLANARDIRTTIAFIHGVTSPAALGNMAPQVSDRTARAAARYAWQSCCGLHSCFGQDTATAEEVERSEVDDEELVDRAIAHGDEHVIKFTEACLHRHALSPSPVYFAAADHVSSMIPRR